MDEIAKDVDNYVNGYVKFVQQHIPIKKAILFGSYASGNYKEDSDVDVAIFSSAFNDKDAVESNALLLSLTRNYHEFCIEPIGFNEYELNQNPFAQEIILTGREIELS